MQTKFVLRSYQEECVNILDNLPSGSKVIVALATGLGKSVCFSHIKRTGKMLILSNRDELVYQPQKYFTCSFGIEKAGTYSNGEDVISASIQTLSMENRLKRFCPDDFEIIIVDECHHSTSPSYKRVLNYFTPDKLIGFTATPTRGDGTKLDDVYDTIIYSKDLLWGIQNGFLSKIKSLAITPNIDISNVQMLAGDYNIASLTQVIDKPEMYYTIANTYRDYSYAEKRHCLIYCINKRSCYITCEYITKLLPDERDHIAVITGETPSEERRMLEESFLKGGIHCIINCMVHTEGVDLPIADTIIVARPSANPTLYTQIIGRGTRLHEKKDYCLVLDILPSSSHKLCSITTLAGVDYKDLPVRLKQKLSSEEIDLEELIELITKNTFAEQKDLSVLVHEYDIINGCYLQQQNLLQKNMKSGFFNLIHALCEKERNGKKQSQDYGIDNFYGIHYQIGFSESARFIIQGDTDNYFFTISEPDILDQVYVQAFIDHTLYKTEKPVSLNVAMPLIRKILQTKCPKLFLWNEDIIDAWNDMPATQKQIDYIYRLFCKLDFDTDRIDTEISKYIANILIKNLTQYEALRKRNEYLKWSIEHNQVNGNPEQDSIYTLVLGNGIQLIKINKSDDFLKLRKEYGRYKINENMLEELLAPGTIEIPTTSGLSRSGLYKLRTLSTATLKIYWTQLLKKYKTDIVLYDISRLIMMHQNNIVIMTRLFLIAQAIMTCGLHIQYEPYFYLSEVLSSIEKPKEKWKWIRIKYKYLYLDKWEEKSKENRNTDNIIHL